MGVAHVALKDDVVHIFVYCNQHTIILVSVSFLF